jgi:isoleucyl-tRNA synthetase
VLSELNRTVGAVIERMDAYDNYSACQRITEFVDGLSNWYVRRSRDRFWSGEKDSADKSDAYWTLYECLLTTSKLIAPFVPFLSEELWQNLAGVFQDRTLQSVHLCDYPSADQSAIDETLSAQMGLLREIASLGRSARMDSKLKVRQPLQKVEVILADGTHQPWLETHDALLRGELNVKHIEYTKDATKYITYFVQPNFKRLGPRVGKHMPAVKKSLMEASGAALLSEMNVNGKISLQLGSETIDLDGEDIQVRLQAKEGWAAAQGRNCVVVLATELTPQLVREGYANDLVRLVQERRKELDCQYTDRIEVGIVSQSSELRLAIEENREYITGETLATCLEPQPFSGCEGISHDLGNIQLTLFVRIAK